MRLSSPHPVLDPGRGCIVSYCPVASAIGTRVLRDGGNAIDASVATALALAVTYPQAGNIGGGGFLLYSRPGGEAHFLDYREVAPRGLREDHFADAAESRTVFGPLSVGVPGTVAGMAEALSRFGTWGWDRLVAPAIDLAETGFWLTTRQAGYFELHHAALSRFPSTSSCFTDGGAALRPGTLLRQPVLGQTLRRLASDGPRSFYEGALAERIASEIARLGGELSSEDLADYRPKWRAPLRRMYHDREIVSAPLPSGGGLVVQLALGLLEPHGMRGRPALSVERIALIARACRVGFALRSQLAADPDHLTDSELQEVAELATQRRTSSDLEYLEGAIGAPVRRASGGNDTTHFCVIDRDGGAVSNTYSLNTLFGSKLVVEGFLLNNVVDDFSLTTGAQNWYDLVQGDRNRLRPGRRPASSMAPTIVLSDGTPEIIVGGSGGPRIPSLVVQIILSLLGDDGTTLEQAIRAPRIHHQFFPDELAVEEAMPEAIGTALAARGHVVTRAPLLGIAAAILRDRNTKRLSAALDSRFSYE